MENEITFFEPLTKRVEAYGKINIELYKLKAIDKTAGITSTLVSRTTAIIAFLIFIIFSSIGGSLWIGELLGKIYYGFLCMAGFYALVFCILYFFMHNWIKKRAGDSIVSQILN